MFMEVFQTCVIIRFINFSLVLILYYVYEHAGSSLHAVKLWSLEESGIQPLLHALLSPLRQQQKEIY